MFKLKTAITTFIIANSLMVNAYAGNYHFGRAESHVQGLNIVAQAALTTIQKCDSLIRDSKYNPDLIMEAKEACESRDKNYNDFVKALDDEQNDSDYIGFISDPKNKVAIAKSRSYITQTLSSYKMSKIESDSFFATAVLTPRESCKQKREQCKDGIDKQYKPMIQAERDRIGFKTPRECMNVANPTSSNYADEVKKCSQKAKQAQKHMMHYEKKVGHELRAKKRDCDMAYEECKDKLNN